MATYRTRRRRALLRDVLLSIGLGVILALLGWMVTMLILLS